MTKLFNRCLGKLGMTVAALGMAVVFLFFLLRGLGGGSGSAVTPDELEQGFVNPPASAKPHTWWHWMNGNITKEGITADLEAMADAGLGGAQIFNVSLDIPAGAVRFNSPEWINMVTHAASEAKRLGLALGMNNAAGWSNSGGPWNTPEHAMKTVVTSEVQLKGGTAVTAALPQPEAHPDFYRDIAVLAFRTPAANPAARVITTPAAHHNSKQFMYLEGSPTPALPLGREPKAPSLGGGWGRLVIDLTNRLPWQAPEGDWTILRVGYTISGRTNNPAPPEGSGLECDKLSREALKAHWNGHIGKVLAALGKTDGPNRPGFNNILIDSYEVGTQNWTQGFEREFERRCGYSILSFLPVFTSRIVDSPEVTERFLWDFRRVVADMFAENYAQYFGELAHGTGLYFSGEPYGSSPSDDIQYGSFFDVPMGEFWPGSDGHSGVITNTKLAASIAHVYGRKVAGAEAFTSTAANNGKWKTGPFELKAQGDEVYCTGINRMVYHRYAHQPWTTPTRYPGMTMGECGTHFERTLTWWTQGKDWLRYQTRCQYMLQEGRFVADVLYYNGEGAPALFHEAALPYGYDYDGCDTRALKMLKVKDGLLTLPSGMSYRMLVLPDDPVMSPEILKVIGKLVDGGAVVVANNKPARAPGLRNYPACDDEVSRLVDKIWPEVVSKSPAEVLQSLGIAPDFGAADEEHIRYIHRELGGMDYYFVACSNPKGGDVNCTFRVSGKTPELWHPETGETETAPVYEEKDGLTTIPIRFSPAGSVFVVFRKPASADHAIEVKYTTAKKKSTQAGTLKIVKAEYGYFADEDTKNCANVTEVVRQSVAGGALTVVSDDGPMKVDPAPGFAKELRINYRVSGAAKQLRLNQLHSATLPRGAEIISAWYGLSSSLPEVDPPRKTADVTEKLASQVQDGALTAAVNSALAGGNDPAPASLKKEVRVEYLYNGVRGWAKANETKTLILPPEPDDAIPLPAYELRTANDGSPEIRVYESGSFEVAMASGETWNTGLVEVPDAVETGGPWQLSFPPNWGAPPQVTLDKLISWTDHTDAGVKYFSGTAIYDKTFIWDVVPAFGTRIILDLGSVKNFAEVRLNGQSFPVLWMPPYRLDITDAVQPGDNTLQIAVTNLWPNRLIGDEQLPDDREWDGPHQKAWPHWVLDGKPSPTGRFTFTTWRHWKKDDALLPSGLLGPVQLRQITIKNE
jgi:hypothetical protein